MGMLIVVSNYSVELVSITYFFEEAIEKSKAIPYADLARPPPFGCLPQGHTVDMDERRNTIEIVDLLYTKAKSVVFPPLVCVFRFMYTHTHNICRFILHRKLVSAGRSQLFFNTFSVAYIRFCARVCVFCYVCALWMRWILVGDVRMGRRGGGQWGLYACIKHCECGEGVVCEIATL